MSISLQRGQRSEGKTCGADSNPAVRSQPYGMWSPAPRTEHFFFTFQIVQSNTPVGFSFYSQLVTFGSGVYREPLTVAPCTISNNYPNDKNISINIVFEVLPNPIEHNTK